jgi:flagellar biosynthesis protein FlhG
MNDQAQRLREKVNKEAAPVFEKDRRTKVITVTSGKGGVGKSNFSLNFALGLIEQGQKVVIIDLDVGFANIDLLMGVSTQKNILDMIDKGSTIWDIIEKGPKGLEFIAGGSGFSQIFELDDVKLNYFFEQLAQLNGYADTIILDTGAGISNGTLRFIMAADEVLLITTPEPTSIMDAYSVVKMAHNKKTDIRFHVVVNKAATPKEGRQTGEKLALVAKQFLKLEVAILGYVPEDGHVTKAVKKQDPFYLSYPNSKAADSIRSLVHLFVSNGEVNRKESGMKAFIAQLRTFWK